MAIEQPTLRFTIDTLRIRREPTPVLTPAFAGEVYSVTSSFPQDTLVASLVAHSPEKRHMVINDLRALLGRNRYMYFKADMGRALNEDYLVRIWAEISRLESRIGIVEQLPPSPEAWQLFMDGITSQEKRALMAVLGHSLGGRRYAWGGLESERTVGDLRQPEVESDFVPTRKVDPRNVWTSLAFRGS